ncbi:MAG: hypothetical protein COS87_02505 [Chloroflexi bacterium CG07_land_8_20_14_0_80_45_17]|nr:MAG: hypothetical protein COX14_02930 [Chloroflexi bacterium CG23_combo_of_CG06-09_8_20_14_all_45_10]PIU56326.1 MAG: hypothetical protein COS87_02505 [Chloroflexi bacterium CG07_land_8_20_14_0_80_45_17]
MSIATKPKPRPKAVNIAKRAVRLCLEGSISWVSKRKSKANKRLKCKMQKYRAKVKNFEF